MSEVTHSSPARERNWKKGRENRGQGRPRHLGKDPAPSPAQPAPSPAQPAPSPASLRPHPSPLPQPSGRGNQQKSGRGNQRAGEELESCQFGQLARGRFACARTAASASPRVWSRLPLWANFRGESIAVLMEADAQMPKTRQHPDDDKMKKRTRGVNTLSMMGRSHLWRLSVRLRLRHTP
jgi:hypothetical protein